MTRRREVIASLILSFIAGAALGQQAWPVAAIGGLCVMILNTWIARRYRREREALNAARLKDLQILNQAIETGDFSHIPPHLTEEINISHAKKILKNKE